MIIRDLLNNSDTVRLIARTIFEDRRKPEEYDGWITKYYAQLVKLRESKIRKSHMMFCMPVCEEKGKIYTLPYGMKYQDIKKGEEERYAIEYYAPSQYAAVYVPSPIVETFGVEVVAAEALKEYGWNGYDNKIICPEDIREQIKRTISKVETGLLVIRDEKNFDEKCKREFCRWYEGRE